MRNKIAIIEDDLDICRMAETFLQKSRYIVQYTRNGADGIQLCRNFCPDLILLDLMLPKLDGAAVLKKLRTFTNVPVIVVSAKTMVQSKIELLRLGADDYVTKPFDLYELLARIEANLKRAFPQQQEQDILQYRDIEVRNSTVFICGVSVPFTATELRMLELFLKYPQKIFSKQNLYETVWQEEYAYEDDTINTHISHIRKKIKSLTGEDYIQTVWGIGYKMKECR